MNVTLTKADLAKAIETVRLKGRNSKIPSLECVLIGAGLNSDRLTVSYTDLQVYLKSYASANIESPGEVAINAITLLKVIKPFLGKDKINLKTYSEENKRMNTSGKEETYYTEKLVLNCGNTNFDIPCFPSKEFPEDLKLAEDSFCNIVRMRESDFAKAMRKIGISIANPKYETRYILTHSEIAVNKEGLSITSTTSTRLSNQFCEVLEWNGEGETSILVCQAAIAELNRVLRIDSEKEIVIFFCEKSVIFQTKDFSLSALVGTGTFPDWKKAVPDSENAIARIIIDRKKLIAGLKKIHVVAQDGLEKVGLSLYNNLNKELVISAFSQELGKAHSSLEILNWIGKSNVTDIPQKFVNINYLLDALNVLESNNIRLELQRLEHAPMMVIGVENADKGFIHVIAPMQLDEVTEDARNYL